MGAATPDYIQVTLPAGVSGGDTIHVQAPDGRLNAIVVPPGFGPGSSFTVEFAPKDDEVKPSYAAPSAPSAPAPSAPPQVATPYVPPANNHHADDGFASGFNNPNYEPDVSYSSYPTATPVYSKY